LANQGEKQKFQPGNYQWINRKKKYFMLPFHVILPLAPHRNIRMYGTDEDSDILKKERSMNRWCFNNSNVLKLSIE